MIDNRTQYLDQMEEWFIELAAHDWLMCVNVIRLRQMIEHRGITLKELAAEVGSTREWLSRALLGKAYWEAGPPDLWRKQKAAYRYLERVEDGITRISDKIGGIAQSHATCIEGYTEALSSTPTVREAFRGRVDRS